MASDYVDDFLRVERESFKRKETAAKKFDSRLDNFRKARRRAARRGEAIREEAFPGMSRTTIADKLAMTGTEKNVAFDAKGELVAAPAGRKTTPAEPEPENGRIVVRRRVDPEPTDPTCRRTTDDRSSRRRTGNSDDGRVAWASGNLMIGRDARCDDHRREAFGRLRSPVAIGGHVKA